MLQKEIKLKGDCQSPVGCPSILVFFDFFLSFVRSKNLGSDSRIFYLHVRLATKINRLDMKTTPPLFRSTVINPNVFLLSLKLLA